MEKLLDLFQRFSKLVTEAFNEDPRFLTARDKAYKQVVNDTQVFKLELPSKTVGWSSTNNVYCSILTIGMPVLFCIFVLF